jgi:hypothetical protein
VLQARGGPRLLLETFPCLGPPHNVRAQHLERDVASEHCVPRTKDGAHAAGTELAQELVLADLAPGLHCRLLASARSPAQVGLDEAVDLAVEDGHDVGLLVSRARVLRKGERLQGVGSDPVRRAKTHV